MSLISFSAQVAVFYSTTSERYYTPSTYKNIINGLLDALEWGKIEYSIVKTGDGKVPDGVEVLIDPSNAALNDSEVNMITEFLMRGGKVLAAYESGLRYSDGKLRPNYIYGDFLGIKYKGWLSGGYNYLQLTVEGKEIFRLQKDYIRMPRGFTFVFETKSKPLALWTRDETGAPSNPNYPVAAVVTDSGIFFGENIYLHTGISDDIKLLIVNSVRYLLGAPAARIEVARFEKAKIANLVEGITNALSDPMLVLRRSFLESARREIEEVKTELDTVPEGELVSLRNRLEKIALALKPSYAVQTRAMWLDHGAILRTGSPEELRRIVRRLHDYGFNVLFPELIYKGTSISPRLSNFPQQREFASWPEDPFQVILDEAKKLGMEVHAWCWVFAVAHGNTVSPLMEKHPQWLEKDKYGRVFTPNQTAWFSHANAEARKYLMEGILEVLKVYDVDGINLDYIRYDSDDMGFDDEAVQAFRAETGVDPFRIEKYTQDEVTWQLWREEKVNSFVKEFYEKAKQLKPDIIVSADVFPRISGARLTKKQNWEHWLYNGYIDVLIPMNYVGSADDLKINLDAQIQYKPYVYLYPGLQLISLRNTDELVAQVYPSLEYFNAGVVLFSLAYLEKFDFGVLKHGVFRKKAIPSHAPLLKILEGFQSELDELLDILKDYGLKPEEESSIRERWNSARETALTGDLEAFFSKLIELFFHASEEIEEPKVSLKLTDTFGWMLEILRPRLLKGTNPLGALKPEGMVVVENAVPIPEAHVPKAKVTIDGDISDWQNLPTIGGFRKHDTGEEVEPNTEVRVAYSDGKLHVLYICKDDDLPNAAKVTGPRDTRTYLGDSVEFFILKDEVKKEYYHFVIGIDGTLYDEIGFDSKWNGEIEYKTWSGEKAWYVEMSVPLEQFGITTTPGLVLKVNFNRNRWRDGKPIYSGWSVTYGSFHTPERFGRLVLGD